MKKIILLILISNTIFRVAAQVNEIKFSELFFTLETEPTAIFATVSPSSPLVTTLSFSLISIEELRFETIKHFLSES